MKKPVTISLDEEVIKIADDLVKSNPEIANRSNLIATLVLREQTRVKRGKKNDKQTT